MTEKIKENQREDNYFTWNFFAGTEVSISAFIPGIDLICTFIGCMFNYNNPSGRSF